jgi:hypothetical protein
MALAASSSSPTLLGARVARIAKLTGSSSVSVLTDARSSCFSGPGYDRSPGSAG